MFGKFGSLLSFRGHSIGRAGARFLNSIPKPRRARPQSWQIADGSEQLECRQLLAADINISQLAGSQAEVSIAVNPTNPLNLVVLSNGGTNTDQFLAYTTDGGQNWTQAPLNNLDDGVGGGSSDRFDGAVNFDKFGNCHIVYMARNGASAIVYGLSTNGGQTFTTQLLEPQGSTDKPWITTGPDAVNPNNEVVIVTFQDGNANLVARGALITGLGNVSSFSTKVTYETFGNGNYGVPAIGPNGEVAITWQDPAGGQSNGNVRFTVDQNGLQGGLSFGSVSTISSTNLGGFDFIPATPDRSTFASPYLAYDVTNGPHRGRLYCVYADETPDESDNSNIYVRYSDNNGLTWSSRTRINDDSSANSQFFQHVSIDPVTGSLFVGWYDARNDNGGMNGSDSDNIANNDVEYWGAQSTDGGVTWSANVQISDGASNQARDLLDPGNDFGDYTGVAFYNGVGYAIWADNSNSTGDNPGGSSTLDVYFDTIQFNLPPTIALVTPGNVTINEDSAAVVFGFTVDDDITLPANLTVTATSSNTSVIANGSLVLGGTGMNRTVSVTPLANRTGRTTITLTVNDGGLSASTSFVIDVLPLPDPLPTPPGTPVTETPFTDAPNLPLTDNGTTTSTISVSGLDTYLFDADVTINITHPQNGQLNVVLISPFGTRVTLTSGNGGTFADLFAGTTFDDQLAAAAVTDYSFQDTVTAPFVVPEGALAQLRGEDPNGDWTLEIEDTTSGAVGTLNSWSLNLATIAAEPLLQTFTSDIFPAISIPDTGVPLLLPLSFNGLDPFTWDVNLRLNIDHTNSRDLDISLISPSGTEVLISSANGSTFDNVYNDATFDDQAAGGTPVTDFAFSNNTSIGSVVPEGALAGFLGEDPNGTWILKIVDRTPSSVGTVNDWGLDITTVFVNDPPTIGTITNPGAILEDSQPITLNLNSISAGGGEAQPLRVTAISSDPSIIPNPTVNYTSPLNSGTLTYQPLPDAFGVAIITVRVEDGGYDLDLNSTADNAVTFKTFTVVVNSVNDVPTLNPVVADDFITDLGTLNEDFGIFDVSLTGISAGGGENQRLQLTATSNQLALSPNPIIDYVEGTSSAVMHIHSGADQNGFVIFTVQAMDGGNDNDLLTLGDNLTRIRRFSLTINPVNDFPTLNAITDPAPINEDAPPQSLVLSNITAGGNEVQQLRVTATSSDPAVVSDVHVDFTPGNTTAPLIFRPAQNGYGTSIITVTVEDSGADGNLNTAADNRTVVQTFTVTINQVNDPPVFSTLGDVLSLDEDPLLQVFNITGISAGPLESQDLSFTVTSSNPALVPTPTLDFISPSDVATLTFNVTPNLSGSSLLTLTLTDAGMDGDLSQTDDNQIFVRTLLVVVRSVNDAPTITAIPDPADLNEGDGPRTIFFSGISAGGGESQPLKVEAFSDLPSIIPSPLVNYTSGSALGSLTFAPLAEQYGTVIITVRVTDGGLDNDLGTAADNGVTLETFTVNVNPINDPPAFSLIPDPAPIDESPTPTTQILTIVGVTPGPNESQQLSFSVVNGDPTKITDPVIDYVTGSATAILSYTPKVSQFGIIPVTVTITDAGQDNDPLTPGDNLTYTQTFYVRIEAFNDSPTLDNIADPLPVDEDAGPQTIPLTNATAGPPNEAGQPLLLTAQSSDPNLITGFSTHVNGLGIPDSLTYALGANRSGTAIVTVTMTDGGLDNNLATPADNKSVVKQFTVTVNSVNDAPSLSIVDSLSNPVTGNYNIAEDSGTQVLSLKNVTPGAFENQPVKITATVGGLGLGLITAPIVSYTSPNSQGALTFTPLANKSGTAVVNLRVEDGGTDGDLSTPNDNLFVTYDLNINIAEVNDPPTLNPIADPGSINEDSGTQFISLSGISAGGNEQQSLLITAVSDNQVLIPNISVVYTNGSSTADLIFTPAANQSGVANIVVTVDDQNGGFVQRFFTVNVSPLNDAPTINSLGQTLTINEDSDLQSIDLSGISGGPGEAGQLFNVTVSSNKPGVIPEPLLIYTPQSPNGQLTFQSLPDQNGTVILTVRVTDGGADNNLNTTGDNLTTTVSLTVNVIPTPEVPVITGDEGTAISTGGRPTPIVPNATLSDPDTTNFKHGGVLAGFVDGERPGDRIFLKRFGSGSERISATRSGLLKRGSNVIGSVAGGTNGEPLSISFSGNVSAKEVRGILRNLHFAGQGRQLGLRTVQIVVTDDTGIQSAPLERNIALN